MDILNQFADDVTEIDISKKNIEGQLDFTRFTKLVKLNCNSNEITSLNNLRSKGTEAFSSEKDIPNSLIELDCRFNEITSLNNLSNSLIGLYCNVNNIKSLDNLVPKGTEAFSSKKTYQIH